MAEEVQKTEAQETTVAQVEEVAVETNMLLSEKTTTPVVEKDLPVLVPLPENEEEDLKLEQIEETSPETESMTSDGDEVEKMPQSHSESFKEESTRVADLPGYEKKALEEIKQLVQDALKKHAFSAKKSSLSEMEEEKSLLSEKEEAKKPAKEQASHPEPVVNETEIASEEKDTKRQKGENSIPEDDQETHEVNEAKTTTASASASASDDDGAKTVEAIQETIVAVFSSLQQEQQPQSQSPAKEPENESDSKDTKSETEIPAEEIFIWGIPLLADDRSDVILLKFLRARDFKVKDAFTMLKNTIRWRKEFGIDELINKEDLRDDLDKVVFTHGFDKEGHPVCYNVYGEFQNKLLYQKTFSDKEKRQRFLRWRIQFLERSIRKLDFTPGGISTIVQVNDLKNSPGPAKWELRQATKQALHLLQDNYPEFVAKQVFINVPWWYLAVKKMISPFLTQRTRSKFVFARPSKSAETLFRYIAADQVPVRYGGLSTIGQFAGVDAVTEITVRAAAKHTVEFPVTEACHVSWELRAVGWDVSYGAEFVPNTEGSYTVIIHKPKKWTSNPEQPILCDNFKINEPGKVVLTIDNPTSKKKKLLYRFKTNPFPAKDQLSLA